ncbi:uncharacterized protein At5g39865 [Momordica charantia]|uniref:Uncharacterized protein At5g39865 n=1 Tax=Momordica charantia TaxID=3673 RepID=A0A6J1CU56_MOMCH|nr:uncharacterized protein At5g39865 [Momordica charantia]
MGCVSSKLYRKDLQRDIIVNHGGDYINHVVSLTSSTYGLLNLDADQRSKELVSEAAATKSPPREDPEVINAWELMDGLEEGIPIANRAKRSPKPRAFLRGLADLDRRSPLKFFNQIGTPKKAIRSAGKENRGRGNGIGRLDYSPREILKVNNVSRISPKSVLKLSVPVKSSPISARRQSFGSDSGILSARRRSLSPLFDPELVASYERQLTEEGEQIKRIVSETPKSRAARHFEESKSALRQFEERCPPGGETAVVIYTTTLRGIRKTFEDCNKVRSIVESYGIHLVERDVSMDSGFREELRALMGSKEVKVPVVFVRGRLIGGAAEVVKLEEEGKLGVLFEGIPTAAGGGGCEGCGGVRFVMCVDCNGSCKVLDETKKKTIKCGECNENGLIQCPICS